jgi:hypothetical protein
LNEAPDYKNKKRTCKFLGMIKAEPCARKAAC